MEICEAGLVELVLYFEFFTDFPVMILCGKTGVIQIFRDIGILPETAIIE